MTLRNPWIDPRITRLRPEQVQAYLARHGWQSLGAAGNPHLLRYEQAEQGEEAPTLFVPVEVNGGPALQWMIELVEELAHHEGRWAVEILADILRNPADPAPANGPAPSFKGEPAAQ